MFLELRTGDDTQPLEDALADDRVTVLIGRTADFVEALRVIGEPDFRAAFTIAEGVVDDERIERWFGDDNDAVLVLLDYAVPDRAAVKRYDINALPFDIGEDTLALEEKNV
jgi:hypothetical protein